VSKKTERQAAQAEIWRITTRKKILEVEGYVVDSEGDDRTIMWECVKQADEMLVPAYLAYVGWPLQKRLPRGADKSKLGSMLRNALSAWLMDDTEQVSWHDADRPALYLLVVQMLQMTSFQERVTLVTAAMDWATNLETYCIKDSEVLMAFSLGMQEAMLREAEKIEAAKRKIARDAVRAAAKRETHCQAYVAMA
jgi:hypothetical protein